MKRRLTMTSHSNPSSGVAFDLRTFVNGYKPLPKLENTLRVRHKQWRWGVRGERAVGYTQSIGVKGENKPIPMDFSTFIDLHTTELLNASGDQENNTITFDITIKEVSRSYQKGGAPCLLPIG